ncbi:MAG: ImmA/IrrE family metallo-endopeptidase [Chloroflexota bacterium]|nr:ImmA/IrrE family metallo-endopeptidase [Chloroflexota bacterium]
MVTDTHLQSIEHVAHGAHTQVVDRFAAYGLIFDNTYDYLFSVDVKLEAVAGVLTGGPVEPLPNLTRCGERLAGVLEWMDTTPFIYYEAYDLAVRQRFSIAHELGHFYLHVKQHAHCHCTHVSIDPQSSDGAVLVTAPGIEREADSFAAALLMPQDLLRGHVTRFGRCVAFLAARYRVSQPAMRRRLRQLGLEG